MFNQIKNQINKRLSPVIEVFVVLLMLLVGASVYGQTGRPGYEASISALDSVGGEIVEVQNKEAQEYLHLLVAVSDNVMLERDVSTWSQDEILLDRATNNKQGYIVSVKDVDAPLGRLERDPKRFVIVKTLKDQFDPLWLEPEVNADGEEISARKYQLPLEKILSTNELSEIKAIPYNDPTARDAIVKQVDNLASLIEPVDWSTKPIKGLKLHGSAGVFSIQEDGGGDYTTLRSAIETEASDISGGTTNAVFYIEEAWTSSEAGNWDVDGWTTTTDARIQIFAVGAATHDGSLNATGWISSGEIDFEEPYCDVTGLQFETTDGMVNVSMDSGDSAAMYDINFDKLIMHGTGNNALCFLNSGSAEATLKNSTMYKTYDAADTTSEGIVLTSGTFDVHNVVISGFDDGTEGDGGTLNIINSVVFNCDDDFDTGGGGTTNIYYTASDSGEGSNAVDLNENASSEWINAFTDWSNGDFTVKDTSSLLYNAGTNTGTPSDDLIGAPRPFATTSDIGAFEFETARAIYRSVGFGSTAALETGSGNALTISGNTATFSVALGNSIGVGDAIQYDDDNDGDIDANDSICFISGRTSSTVFTVQNTSGATPTPTAEEDQDWSIYRAYTSLSNAESGDENDGLDDDLEAFESWVNGKDISAASGSNEQWNIACYADATDTVKTIIDGWTTSTDNYLKIFTPVSSSEVGASQRHNGVWDTNSYLISGTGGTEDTISIKDNFIVIDGLQVDHVSASYGAILIHNGDSTEDNCVIKNCIVKGTGTSSGQGIVQFYDSINSQVYSTIIDMTGTSMTAGLTFRYGNDNLAYNVTIYGRNSAADIGINRDSETNTVLYNCLVQNTAGDAYTAGFAAASSNNISHDATAVGTNVKINMTIPFVDAVQGDFHLAQNAVNAINVGTTAPSSIFTDDIDGDTRPIDGAWDIGADEHAVGAGTTAIIYRSVGPGSVAALQTGAGNNLTITGTTASFATAIGNSIGVGDVIQYDDDNDGDIDADDSLAFISARASSTSFTVQSVSGGTPTATLAADQDWDIYRAYTSLFNAEAGDENDGLDDDLEAFESWVDGKDITEATGTNEQWNIACYADAVDSNAVQVDIDGWTTETNHYIKIYTPVTSSEVGVSQRHSGKWDENKYTISSSEAYDGAVRVYEDFVRLEGLQVENTADGSSVNVKGFAFEAGMGAGYEIQIIGNILRYNNVNPTSSNADCAFRMGFSADGTFIVRNNIIYDWYVGFRHSWSSAGGIYYVDNNTVINSAQYGIELLDSVDDISVYLRNNLVQGSGTGDYQLSAFNNFTQSNNISEDLSSPDDTYDGKTVSFADEASDDFHLAIGDTMAIDVGTTTPGALFADDIDGQTRDANWDIGADEAVENTISFTGTVYTDQGSTNIGAAKTVAASVNGAAVGGSDDTDGSGVYTIPGIAVNYGDVLSLYIEDETENGVTVTVAGNDDMTGLDIYQNYLITRQDNAGGLTNANLETADNNADADILAIYSAPSGVPTTVEDVNLYIPGVHTFAPAGNVVVNGSWINTGTFTASTGAVMLGSTSPAATITSGTDAFNDLVINDGLVGYWKFDESTATTDVAGVLDSSGYGHTGIWKGDPGVSTTTPNVNFVDSYSLDFDGSGDYVLSSLDKSTIGSVLTISMWIRPEGAQTTRGIFQIADNLTSSTPWILFQRTNSTQVGWYLDGDYRITQTINDDEFYQIAITYDGTTWRAYKNGVADGTYTGVIGSYGGGSTWIGNGYNGDYDGIIDDIRIYNRVLSATEIARLAQGDQPQTGTGTYALQDALDVDGSLTLASGTLDVNAQDITVEESWFNYGGIFDEESQSIAFGGTTSGYVIQSGSEAFYDVTINGAAGAWTLYDDLEATNALTITNGTLTHDTDLAITEIKAPTTINGGTFTGVASSIAHVGNLTVSSGTYTAPSEVLTISGNLNVAGGTFTEGGGTVIFAAADADNTITTNAETFNDVSIGDGLEFYWKFDETAENSCSGGEDSCDSMDKGIHGTFLGSAAISTSTPMPFRFDNQRSVYLDGTDSGVDFGDNGNLSGSLGLTVSVWINPQTISDQHNIIFRGNTTSTDGYSIYILNTDEVRFRLTTESTGSGSSVALNTTSSPISATNRWYHICVTYSDGDDTMRIFVDGEEEISSNALASGPLAGGGDSLNLGSTEGLTYDFIGNVDDLRIYNRALSEIEIEALAKSEVHHDVDNTFTLQDDFDANGSVTLSTGTLATNTNDMTVAGSWTDVATFSAASSTVTFNATDTGNEIYSTGSLPFVVFDDGGGDAGGWVLSSDVIMTGDVTVSATDSVDGFNLNGKMLTVANNVSIAAGGELTTSGSLAIVNGSWTNSGGDHTSTTGTVVFVSSDADETITTGSSAFNDVAITDGLVGYWRFDESSGSLVEDSSGYGNHGTWVASPTVATSTPNVNFVDPYSLYFDGTQDSIDMQATDSIEDTKDSGTITIAMWLKNDNTAGTEQGIFSFYVNDDNAQFLRRYQATGNLRMYQYVDSVGSGMNTSTSYFNDTQWHHLACVINGADVDYYYDVAIQNLIRWLIQ